MSAVQLDIFYNTTHLDRKAEKLLITSGIRNNEHRQIF